MASGDARSLALLVDASPAGWAALRRPQAPDLQPLGAESYIQQVLAFVNAYLLQSEDNELAVWGVAAGASRLLWASPSLEAALGRDAAGGGGGGGGGDGSSLGADPASTAVLAGLRQLCAAAGGAPAADDTNGEAAGEAAWSAATARALCQLHKAGRSASDGTQRTAPEQQRRGAPPRLLCLKAAPDSPPQYLASMNAAFSAQRCGVVVDACVLGAGHSAFLQQAAHLTGGVYVRPARPAALLQYLLAVFLASPAERQWLALPAATPVDLRASCFCHRRPVDIGYACSVCLSVFCQRGPECATCGTTFAARRPANAAVKRPLPAS